MSHGRKSRNHLGTWIQTYTIPLNAVTLVPESFFRHVCLDLSTSAVLCWSSRSPIPQPCWCSWWSKPPWHDQLLQMCRGTLGQPWGRGGCSAAGDGKREYFSPALKEVVWVSSSLVPDGELGIWRRMQETCRLWTGCASGKRDWQWLVITEINAFARSMASKSSMEGNWQLYSDLPHVGYYICFPSQHVMRNIN